MSSSITRLLLGLAVLSFRLGVILPLRVLGDVLGAILVTFHEVRVTLPDLPYEFLAFLGEVGWTLEFWGLEVTNPQNYPTKEEQERLLGDTEEDKDDEEVPDTGDYPRPCIYCDAGTSAEGSDWIN